MGKKMIESGEKIENCLAMNVRIGTRITGSRMIGTRMIDT
jgi:hypothetical protein